VSIGGALVLVGALGVVRAVVPGAALVLLCTVPVGVGIAVAGTLLPVVVKEEYAERPTLGTGVYTTGINVGATIASVAAVPIAVVAGWRGSLVAYSVVTVAVAVPWLRERHATPLALERAALPLRLPIAWALAAVFASQSVLFYGFNAWLAEAYVDRGWDDTTAGGLVALVNAVALVAGIVTALTADRFGSRRGFLVGGATCSLVAAILIAADVPTAWAWASLLGVGTGILFTTVMALPLDAAHGRAEVAALSTLMLGVGYSLSALAPSLLGAVRDATGTFTVPLALLAGDAFLLLTLSATISRRRLAAAASSQ
jgi:CP family cyanate transporter-like MFS transporter